MDVLGSEGGGVSRIRDTVGEQCFGISFWLFRNARWGHPKPRPACFHWSGEHACGVAFSLPLVAVPAHPRRKDGGCRRRSKSFSWCGFCMGIDIFSFAAYNNSTRQATACVCQALKHSSVPESLAMRSFQ